ncbi:hypothetical protein [Nonomuraea africana]|uniref:Peptidase MA-like domain-containing protein n=1 Tax=Nonomuraea africana TaxID=46171 RepID=A0ABR9KIY2_9ACTN|nr:hypothetical protein [Nonomuraea africana]MBE1561598.1 hypothetical protein [Nonomuraea africana]
MVTRRTLLAAALAGTVPASAGPLVPPEARGLWESGVTFAYGTRSLALGHHAPAALLRDLAARADAAGRTVTAVLRRAVRPVVVVPATTAEAAALAGTGSVEGLAALASEGRVIVVPGAFARLTPVGRDVVLAHELTHVAAGTYGRPVWLREGFADYVGYLGSGLDVHVAAAELAAEVRSGRAATRLPADGDFAPGSPRLAQVYQESWLACRLIATRYGERALAALYDRAAGRDLAQALRPLGLSVTALTGLWREYVRDELTARGHG